MHLRQILLFLILLQWNLPLFAQLTADSIRHYLIGKWVLCESGLKSYYFDSDSGSSYLISEYDEYYGQDSTITFFADTTFSLDVITDRKRFTISRLLNAYESPYKIELGKTEYIFEIRNEGFFLFRLILGTYDENEEYLYFFKRPGKCEKKE